MPRRIALVNVDAINNPEVVKALKDGNYTDVFVISPSGSELSDDKRKQLQKDLGLPVQLYSAPPLPSSANTKNGQIVEDCFRLGGYTNEAQQALNEIMNERLDINNPDNLKPENLDKLEEALKTCVEDQRKPLMGVNNTMDSNITELRNPLLQEEPKERLGRLGKLWNAIAKKLNEAYQEKDRIWDRQKEVFFDPFRAQDLKNSEMIHGVQVLKTDFEKKNRLSAHQKDTTQYVFFGDQQRTKAVLEKDPRVSFIEVKSDKDKKAASYQQEQDEKFHDHIKKWVNQKYSAKGIMDLQKGIVDEKDLGKAYNKINSMIAKIPLTHRKEALDLIDDTRRQINKKTNKSYEDDVKIELLKNISQRFQDQNKFNLSRMGHSFGKGKTTGAKLHKKLGQQKKQREIADIKKKIPPKPGQRGMSNTSSTSTPTTPSLGVFT
jgi:hypothetical protein